LRQGLRRPGGQLPPGGARRDRQDAGAFGEERRTQGADRQGSPRDRRAPRACQAPADAAGPVVIRRSLALLPLAAFATAAAVAAVTHAVPIEGMAFKLATVNAARGDTVTWTNKDV